MDIGDQADRVKFMIHDRGTNFITPFDAVLADAGIRTVLCNSSAYHQDHRVSLGRVVPTLPISGTAAREPQSSSPA
jgi:hypothetical protein